MLTAAVCERAKPTETRPSRASETLSGASAGAPCSVWEFCPCQFISCGGIPPSLAYVFLTSTFLIRCGHSLVSETAVWLFGCKDSPAAPSILIRPSVPSLDNFQPCMARSMCFCTSFPFPAVVDQNYSNI